MRDSSGWKDGEVRKYSQPVQRCRNGQARPSAATLVGSVQIPKATATWPTWPRMASVPERPARPAPDSSPGGVHLEGPEAVLGLPRPPCCHPPPARPHVQARAAPPKCRYGRPGSSLAGRFVQMFRVEGHRSPGVWYPYLEVEVRRPSGSGGTRE
jgi:hypothetical protein